MVCMTVNACNESVYKRFLHVSLLQKRMKK